MAKLADKVAKQAVERCVIIRFCGSSAGSATARTLMLSICGQIEFLYNLERKVTGMNDEQYDNIVVYFQSLMRDHVVILFVDSLDQLSDKDLGRSQISFLKGMQLHPDSRVVVSCLKDELVPNPVTGKQYLYLCDTRLKENGVPRVDVVMSKQSQERATDEAMLVVDELLKQKRRILTCRQREIVRSAASSYSNQTALYLNLAVLVVSQWSSALPGSEEQLAGGVSPLIHQIFGGLEREFGQFLVQISIGFITYSALGLSDVEMEDLLSVHSGVLEFVFQYAKPGIRRIPSHVWLRIKRRLIGMRLVVEAADGCIVWFHRQLREEAEKYFRHVKIETHRILGEYFGNLIPSESRQEQQLSRQEWTLTGLPLVQSSKVNKRRCREASFSMLQGNNFTLLEKELCNFEGICCKLRCGEGFRLISELLALLNALTKGSCDPTENTLSSVNQVHRVRHYLRWLQQDIHFLVASPLDRFLSSAAKQPQESLMRQEALQLSMSHPELPCGIPMGCPVTFDGLLSTLEGHLGKVTSVSFSPDNRKIVSGSADKTLRLWDAETGALVSVMEGHLDEVSSVCFSPDGKKIASASKDKTVRVWDTRTGSALSTLTRHSDAVCFVRFSPDGWRIVSASVDTMICVWDVMSFSVIKRLKGHTLKVTSLAFFPNGSQIVSGSSDKVLRIWELSSGRTMKTMEGHRSGVNSVDCSHDGLHVVSGSDDKTVRLWDAESGQHLFTFEGHLKSVTTVCFSPDGTLVLSGSHDCSVRTWCVETHDLKLTHNDHDNYITTACFNPHGTHIASGSFDRSVRIWDSLPRPPAPMLQGHRALVTSLSVSADGAQVVSGSKDKSLRIWNIDTADLKLLLEGHSGEITSVCFSSDGSRIVSGSKDLSIRVWDVQTTTSVCTIEGHTQNVTAVCFSPDDSKILSGSFDNSLRVWDSQTGIMLAALEGHQSKVTSACFSPDGLLIVSGSWDKTVRLWDANTSALLSTLEGHNEFVEEVCFSHDGTQIASASWDCTVRVWDTKTADIVATFNGHSQVVRSVSFSLSDRLIISGSGDATIRVWDAKTGTCLSVMEGHSGAVSAVGFGPDDSSVISCSWDGTVRVWHAMPSWVVQDTETS